MPNIKAFFADKTSAKSLRDMAWIALFSVAVLSVSSGIAWVLHSGVTTATAQSGQQLAATAPDRNSSLLRADPGSGLGEGRAIVSRIEKITIEDQKASVVEGRAPVRALVTLSASGKTIGMATANIDGNWSVAIERGLGVGDHRLAIRTAGVSGDDVGSDTARISVPRGLSGPLVITYSIGEPSPARAAIADARIALAQGPVGAFKSVTDSATSYPPVPAAARPIILAQSAPAPAPTPPTPPSTGGSALDALQNWLRRSNETYQKAIVKRLTEPATLEEIEARAKADEAKTAVDPRSAAPKAADVTPVDPKIVDPKVAEDAAQKAREALRAAQAKRDEDLKQAEAKKKAADDLAAKEAAAKTPAAAPAAALDEAARKQAEDKRIADETIKRQADLRAAEEKRAADAKKVADEAASKSADAKKAADDAGARKQVDDKRLADEAQRRQADLKAAEERRAADASARKQADEKRAVDAKKAFDDAAAAAKAAEAKKAADDAVARKQADDRRIAEETTKRVADAKKVTNEKRLAADAAKRAADDAKRASDQAREAETRRQAELRATEDARRRDASLAAAASKVMKPSNPAVAMVEPKAPPPGTAATSPTPEVSSPVATLRTSRSSRRARTSAAAGARRQAKRGCELAGNRVATPPGYYIVKAGDTLWDIADLHYDDGTRFAVLRRANRRIHPNLIRPCQRIFVPADKRS